MAISAPSKVNQEAEECDTYIAQLDECQTINPNGEAKAGSSEPQMNKRAFPKKPRVSPHFPQPSRVPSASIPKFGDWNTNPSHADGYTIVFERVKSQRCSEPGLADGFTAAYSDTKSKVGIKWRSLHIPPSGPRTKQPKQWGCFPRIF